LTWIDSFCREHSVAPMVDAGSPISTGLKKIFFSPSIPGLRRRQ
jgi:hypothetical protein